MKNKFLIKFPSIIFMSILVLFITSCQDPMSPVVEDESIISGPGALTLDDETSVEFRVVMNKEVTCTVVTDTSGYDQSNVIMPLIEIEGEIDTGKTAKISFRYLESTASGFTSDHRIAYWDSSQSGWKAVTSTLESYNLTISATVDHFSVWTVINTQEVEAVPIEVDISGTVTIDMGAEWTSAYWDDLAGKALSVLLLDSATQAPISGNMVYSLRDDWIEQTVNVYTVDYIITAVEAGSYLVAAIIDVDGDGEQEGDEPLMLYGGAASTVIVVSTNEDISGIDLTLETVSVSGTVTLDGSFISEYSGEEIYLMLMTIRDDDINEARYIAGDNPMDIGTFDFGSSIDFINYTVEDIPTAYYIVGAFVDLNSNGFFDIDESEPYGVRADNGEPAEAFPVLLESNLTAADILIDTILTPPEVEITSPAATPALEDLIFDVSGTVDDDEDPEGGTVSVVAYTPSNVNLSTDPPDLNGEPVAEGYAVIDSNGDWTVTDLDLSATGYGDYVILAFFSDSDDLLGGDYVEITIEIVFTSEGSVGSPYELSEGTPHEGEVDTGFSYYSVPVSGGNRYLVTMDNLTDDARLQLFSEDDFTFPDDFIENGQEFDSDCQALTYEAESTTTNFYLRVSGGFCADGAVYTLLIEQLTDTITLSGNITIDGIYPSSNYPMIIELREYNEGTITEISETAVGGTSSVAFSFSGEYAGNYDIFAFLDENENGIWDYTGASPEYSGSIGSWTWVTDDISGISIEVIQEEF